MANSGPIGSIPKIIFICDLDYTHFNTAKEGVTWIGSENDWLAFYDMCRQVAAHRGVELLFAVVTNKPSFDDIAETAAISFKHLLSINNHAMYVDGQRSNWCLVRHDKQLRYECLSEPKSTPCHFTNVTSHFVVVPNKNKAPYIHEIAAFHQIPPENCLVLDDTPDVLLDVKNNGMQTVGFEKFCPQLVDTKRLDDPSYVAPYLQAKRREIFETLHKMIDKCAVKSDHTETARSYDHAYVSTEFLQVLNEYDPPDCLHSWGSFRLLHGNPSFMPPEPTDRKAPSLSLFKRSL